MSRTRRGGNSKTSAALAAREEDQYHASFAQSTEESEAVEEEASQTEDPQAPKDQEVEDAEKTALAEFTVAQLKKRLRTLGKPVSGRKDELIARLLEAA